MNKKKIANCLDELSIPITAGSVALISSIVLCFIMPDVTIFIAGAWGILIGFCGLGMLIINLIYYIVDKLNR